MIFSVECVMEKETVLKIKSFLSGASGKTIFHVSDTSTELYPLLVELLDLIKPDVIIHTGDLADEYKVGRHEEDLPPYRRALDELAGILKDANCLIYVTPGNNDSIPDIEKYGFNVLPNGSTCELFGIKLALDHTPIVSAYNVDFAVYGHGATEDFRIDRSNVDDGVVCLNGDFSWTVIDSSTKRYIEIPVRKKPKCVRIYVARHGQVAGNAFYKGNPDYPKDNPALSELGIRQAHFLAEELKRIGFGGRILCSPYMRTIMTAQPISRALDIKIDLCHELREIIRSEKGVASFDGKPADELKLMYPEISDDTDIPYPWWTQKPESFDDVSERVKPLIDKLIEKGEDVLLIGHGASAGAAVDYLLEKSGLEFNDFMPRPVGANCTLSEFRLCGKKLRPVTVYGVSHLPATMITANIKKAMNPPKTESRYYLTQMHLHAGFEECASIRSHAVQAKRLGYDAIYITEHDVRMNRMKNCIERFVIEDEKFACDIKRSAGFYRPDGALCTSVRAENGLSMPIKDGETAIFKSKGKRHQASLLSGLILELKADLNDCKYLQVAVRLSQKPDSLEPQYLTYIIGDGSVERGWCKFIPKSDDGIYTLELFADALYFDPAFGLDNAFLSLELTPVGGEAKVSGFETSREFVAEQVRAKQMELAGKISVAYGIKIYSGFELSFDHHRNCFSEDVPVINYENTGYVDSEETGFRYLSSKRATYAYNHMFEEWKKDTETSRREIIDGLVERLAESRCDGAQLLEVGFPEGRSGFSLAEHLQVWDRLALAGVRMVGYGDSDSHNSSIGWRNSNNFGTWIWAESCRAKTLEKAMRGGNLCMGDPVRMSPDFEFSIDGKHMGDVLSADDGKELFAEISFSKLKEKVELRVVCGGKIVKSVAINSEEFSDRVKIEMCDGIFCPVRLELYGKDGRCIFLTNPIYITK